MPGFATLIGIKKDLVVQKLRAIRERLVSQKKFLTPFGAACNI